LVKEEFTVIGEDFPELESDLASEKSLVQSQRVTAKQSEMEEEPQLQRDFSEKR